MSPVSSSGRWYNDPEQCERAEVDPQVLGTGTVYYTFDAEDIDTLMATLHTHEYLSTALTGNNNDLNWVGAADGTSTVTVQYAVAGTSTPLSIDVDTTAKTIKVNVATNASATAISTANDILGEALADGELLSLAIPSLKTGNTGVGVVTALTATDLGVWAGSSLLDTKLETSVDGTNWYQVGASYAQKTTAVAAPTEGRAFAGLGSHCRWTVAVTGTTPGVALSISATDTRSV